MILTEYDEEKYRDLERKENKNLGRALSILELLEDCGNISDELRQKILNEQNEQILKQWLKLAARSSSLEEFGEPHMTKVTCFSAALSSKTKYRRIRP